MPCGVHDKRPRCVLIALWLSFLAGLCRADVEEVPCDPGKIAPAPPLQPAADDWPWWRGPQRTNVAMTQELPLEWSPGKNIVWSVEVPGRGNASPIVSGNLIVLATADETEKSQWLLGYDRTSGRELWKTKLHQGGFMKEMHRKCTHASATPACDGERIFGVFIHEEELWVSAVDMNGKLLWQTRAGSFDAYYGFGMSPVLYGPLVIVVGDNDRPGGFMAAIHRVTGQVVWRIKRPNIDTYCTPITGHIAGRDQLLVGGAGLTCSYDPLTGKLLWQCIGPTEETTANSAAFSADDVFISGGYPTPYTLISIRGDGNGDVTASHLRWTVKAKMPYVPSPLYHDGLIYIAADNGIASCLDAATGKPAWSKRIPGDHHASPVICGDRVYFASEQGPVYVMQAGRKGSELAQNDLGEGTQATLAICGGRIYLRTHTKLHAIGAK